jgi:RNA polymerase sigma-70 factor (ECF subfamily)
MAEVPVTRPSLLVRLRDAGDRLAWQEFVELYGLLIYRYGRRRGLQDADAADLTQVVLQAVCAAIGRLEFDPSRGPFRSWLYTIVRRQLHKLLRRQPGPSAGELAVLEDVPDREDGGAEWWEQEYRQRCFRWAAERVRGDFEGPSWQAFWQTAVDGRPPREVADALGLSLGAVYTAKCRVLQRIREEIAQLEDEGPR